MANLWSGSGSAIGNSNSVTTPFVNGLVNTQGAASTYSSNQNINPNVSNVIQFTPSNNSNFQFQATFDNVQYNVIVNWNIYGERYYINIYDTNNALILCVALIGSPLNYNISLTAGYFTTQLVYRQPTQQFEVIG
jgi:hypothetical protein